VLGRLLLKCSLMLQNVDSHMAWKDSQTYDVFTSEAAVKFADLVKRTSAVGLAFV
jgi:hypothetical protein